MSDTTIVDVPRPGSEVVGNTQSPKPDRWAFLKDFKTKIEGKIHRTTAQPTIEVTKGLPNSSELQQPSQTTQVTEVTDPGKAPTDSAESISGQSSNEPVVKNNHISAEQKQIIRQRTKSSASGRREREMFAREIQKARKRQQEFRKDNKIPGLTDRQEKQKVEMDRAKQEWDQAARSTALLKAHIAERETNLAKRINDLLRPAEKGSIKTRLNSALATQTEAVQQYFEVRREYDEISSELKQLIKTKKSLDETPFQLRDQFYQINAQRLHEEELVKQRAEQALLNLYEYRNRAGTLDIISKKYNAYFVHGTNSEHQSGKVKLMNPVLKTGRITWQDKVAVIAEYAPTIATSSIQVGKPHRLWEDFGVILSKGVVEEANPSDSGSIASGLKDRRVVINSSTSIETYEKNIKDAITMPDAYNEIIVGGDPQIAGLYINFDSPLASTEGITAAWDNTVFTSYQEIFGSARSFGMDVFVFKNGMAHEAQYDYDNHLVILGAEVPPAEMLQRRYTVPAEQKDRISNQAQRNLSPLALVA